MPGEGPSDGLNCTVRSDDISRVVSKISLTIESFITAITFKSFSPALVSVKCDGFSFTVQCREMMGEDISRRHGGNRTIVTADRREKEDDKRMKKEESQRIENGKIEGMTKG